MPEKICMELSKEMMPFNVLITGCSGLLGSNLCGAYADRHNVTGVYFRHRIRYPAVQLVQCDLADPRSTKMLAAAKPDIVIHTAGEANVDRCERNPIVARAAICDATRNVAAVAESCGSYLIYLSTDAVFDGRNKFVRESDPAQPVNLYGKLKVEAEEIAALACPSSCIVRTRFYGWSPGAQKSFVEQIISSLEQKKTVNCFTDNFSTYVYVGTLARCFGELFDTRYQGILHIVESERFSRFDFAHRIAQAFELEGKLILPARMSEHSFDATRPADTSLCNDLARSLLKTDLGGNSLNRMRTSSNPVKLIS
jgi:dTDP-4-dehydrorhamnose reductase